MTRPFNRVIEAVAAIAAKLGATVSSTGDRLADNLEAIAESGIGAFPELPEEAGTYILKATVTEEGAELSWEAAT